VEKPLVRYKRKNVLKPPRGIHRRFSEDGVENASSLADEAEGFEKSLLSKVFRLET
jgi:hypothetical protein